MHTLDGHLSQICEVVGLLIYHLLLPLLCMIVALYNLVSTRRDQRLGGWYRDLVVQFFKLNLIQLGFEGGKLAVDLLGVTLGYRVHVLHRIRSISIEDRLVVDLSSHGVLAG